MPDYSVIVALHPRFRYTAPFRKVCERGYDLLSATVEMHVLDRVEEGPVVSSRVLDSEGRISQSNMTNIVHKYQYRPLPFHTGIMITSIRLRNAVNVLPLAIKERY